MIQDLHTEIDRLKRRIKLCERIMLDEGSFVEIGGAVTARSTTFNLQEKAAPSDGVITGYGEFRRFQKLHSLPEH